MLFRSQRTLFPAQESMPKRKARRGKVGQREQAKRKARAEAKTNSASSKSNPPKQSAAKKKRKKKQLGTDPHAGPKDPPPLPGQNSWSPPSSQAMPGTPLPGPSAAMPPSKAGQQPQPKRVRYSADFLKALKFKDIQKRKAKSLGISHSSSGSIGSRQEHGPEAPCWRTLGCAHPSQPWSYQRARLLGDEEPCHDPTFTLGLPCNADALSLAGEPIFT